MARFTDSQIQDLIDSMKKMPPASTARVIADVLTQLVKERNVAVRDAKNLQRKLDAEHKAQLNIFKINRLPYNPPPVYEDGPVKTKAVRRTKARKDA
jgi:hypothetical protein